MNEQEIKNMINEHINLNEYSQQADEKYKQYKDAQQKYDNNLNDAKQRDALNYKNTTDRLKEKYDKASEKYNQKMVNNQSSEYMWGISKKKLDKATSKYNKKLQKAESNRMTDAELQAQNDNLKKQQDWQRKQSEDFHKNETKEKADTAARALGYANAKEKSQAIKNNTYNPIQKKQQDSNNQMKEMMQKTKKIEDDKKAQAQALVKKQQDRDNQMKEMMQRTKNIEDSRKAQAQEKAQALAKKQQDRDAQMKEMMQKTKNIEDSKKAQTQAQQEQQEKNKLSYKIGEGVKKQTDSVKNTATKAGQWVKDNPKKQIAGGAAIAAATGGLLLLRSLLKKRKQMKEQNQSTTNIDNQIKNVRNKMKS